MNNIQNNDSFQENNEKSILSVVGEEKAKRLSELEELKKQLDSKKNKLTMLEESYEKIDKELERASVNLEDNQREVILLTEQVNLKVNRLNELQNTYNEYMTAKCHKHGLTFTK